MELRRSFAMSEAEILMWAAGSVRGLPTSTVVNERLLIDAVCQHGLAGRLIERLNYVPAPSWATNSLLERLRREQAVINERLQALLEAAADMMRAWPIRRSSQPIIFIKGFNAYALTGNRAHLRLMRDVDVVVSDPQRFRNALLRIGYEEGFNKMPHEFVTLTGSFDVDVHKFFPVWRYPESSARLVPSRQPDRWRPQGWMANRQIRYEDLLANAVTGSVPETRNMTIPGPTMAALIRSAHMFKRYVEVPAYLPFAKIRLAEVAEIAELCSHPGFDERLFRQLVLQFSAFDVTRFAATTQRIYLGMVNVPTLDSPSTSRGFGPRDLYWGALMHLEGSPTEFLIHETDTQSIVNGIGYSTVVAGETDSRVYSTHPNGVGQVLPRVILGGNEELELPVRLNVRFQADSLRLDVSVLDSIGDILEEVVLLIGHRRVYCGYRVAAQEFVVRGLDARASMKLEPAGYTVSLVLPWRSIATPRSRSAFMVLAVCRFLEEGIEDWGKRFHQTVGSTILPIKLVVSGRDVAKAQRSQSERRRVSTASCGQVDASGRRRRVGTLADAYGRDPRSGRARFEE